MASLDLMKIDIDVLATIQEWLGEHNYGLEMGGHYITVFHLKWAGGMSYPDDDNIDFENFNQLLEWIRKGVE